MAYFIMLGVLLLLITSVYIFRQKLSSKLILFSEVSGQIVDGEKFLSNIDVERTINWQDQEFREIVKSNENGEFKFKPLERNVYLNFLFPSEPFIEQKITFHVSNKKILAWAFTKRNYRKNSELEGKNIQLICDINNEPKRIGSVFGVCRFNEDNY